MAVNILVNYVEATVTAGGTTSPAAGAVETWTVTTTEAWPVLNSGEQITVVDKADLGTTSGYELMLVTADANGSGVDWTVTRGVENTTPKDHASSWTVVPAYSAAAFDGRYAQQVALQSETSRAEAAEALAVTSVTNSDGTVVTSGTTVNPILSRAAITGDVAVPAGSNTATLGVSGATAGTYNYATVTVTAKGIVTAASNGTPPVASVGAGTGVTIGGTATAPTVSVTYGTTSGTAAQGNDTRFGTATVVSGVTVSGTPAVGQVLTATSATAADWAPAGATTSIDGVTVSGTPTAGQVLTATSSTAADWATPASSPSLLAYVAYDPTTIVAYTAGTTMAAVDSTNLAATFTAPADGTVLVRISLVAFSNGYSVPLTLGLFNGGTQVGSSVAVLGASTSAITGTQVFDGRLGCTIEVTGLTAGSSYTLDLAAQGNGNGDIVAGGSNGPLVIEVWSIS